MLNSGSSGRPALKRNDRVGEVIGNRYRLEALLERGGQGSVYRAYDLFDEEEVAVKLLAEEASNDPLYRERMFREAKAMCVLQGSAAVRVFDQQWTDDDVLCLILELLHGVDLDSWLSSLEERGERLETARLIELFGPIVDTLEMAHHHGIVHRDLKPGNVFVLDESKGRGKIRLLDFGFAKFTRLPGLTQFGFIAGSPSYIAPETWRDEPPDLRVDVYGLGALIFRCLAGRPPFLAKEALELLRLVTTAERPSLHALREDLPPQLDDWLEHALAIQPEERFQTVRALWNAFRAVVA